MQEITIPLRFVGENEVGQPEDYFKVIHDEYASRYLEALGVAPTQTNKAMVMRNMPLKDCELQASWASRTSAVADSITVLPPQRKKITDDSDFEGLDMLRKSQWYGQAEYISVAPPKVATLARSQMKGDDKDDDAANAAREGMELLKHKDALSSEGADGALTREIETFRLQRGGADVKGAKDDEQDEERQKRRENELVQLKQKFILPFACEQPAAEGGGTVLISWHAPALQGDLNLEVPELLRQEVLQPITITLEDIKKEVSNFVAEYLPLELLTTRPQEPSKLEEIRKRLVANDVVRLAGLLSHFLYWNSFGHLHHERQLPETSKQSLFLTIHELWSHIEKQYKVEALGVSYVIPVAMLTLKWSTERCFGVQYPKFMADTGLCQALVDRINVLFMRLFDPDCRYTHFGAFDGTMKAIKLSRKLSLIQSSMGHGTTKRTVHKLNRATPLVRSVMNEGGCIDPKTRAMINRNSGNGAADQQRQAQPGSPQHKPGENRMDDWKRVALYHVAKNRLFPDFEEERVLKEAAKKKGEKSKLPPIGSKGQQGAAKGRARARP